MRRVALLPNIVTTGNIVCGLSAILYSLSGHPDDFRRACWMIILAIILDGLDGLIAVLTRTCSNFGVQYDSMADLVSFGVAPAMLIFANYRTREDLTTIPSPVFWAITTVLVVCVAIRLARYNVQAGNEEKKQFVGLPSPTPAGFIVLLLLSFKDFGYSLPAEVLLLITIGLGALMVSHVPYPIIKRSDFFRTQPISALLLVVLAFALAVMEPVGVMLTLVSGYLLAGIIAYITPPNIVHQIEKHLPFGNRSA